MIPRVFVRFHLGWLATVITFIALSALAADDLRVVQGLLRQSIIGPDIALAEVQSFTEGRVPRMPEVKSVAEWESVATQLRRDILDKVVFRGEAAKWRREKTKVVWLETIEGGPGYRIRKLRYEAVPGLWIPALLYEPEHLSGKVPVALNVNGHEGIGKSVPYKQARCINQAKRGLIVLNAEWIGMGQLNSTNCQHYRMNQLDLCGTSGLAPFYLAMSRGLDILLAHPNADPARVAVSGLSGGGWQTIFISTLDPRVTFSNPVAGYSSFRTRTRHFSDLGDSEQTPCDLATVADYAHLTAMLAPRAALLTYNFKDNCCFASPHALQPLLDAAAPIYRLYGKEKHLRSHVNYDPGDHNFGPDNRQAHYQMLGDFFYPETPAFNATEIPCDGEIKAHTNLLVELPPNNADFNSLARTLAEKLPRQPKLPARKSAADKWQQANRAKLRDVVRAKHSTVTAIKAGETATNGITAIFWKLRVDDDWTVPAVELVRGEASKVVLLLADSGRTNVATEVQELLNSGHRVLAIDTFYFGETRIRTHDFLFALLVAAVGERPLGVQAGQLAGIARWATGQYSVATIELIAIGPRTSTAALVAAGLEAKAIGKVELRNPLGSLKQIIEENAGVNRTPELFCFGFLEAFDMRHLAALVAPRLLLVSTADEQARAEFATLDDWYRTFGVAHRVAQ